MASRSRAQRSPDRFADYRPETQRRIAAARPAIRLAWIAGSLFAERGFGATSIRDIAAAAGVAPSSVYSHYPSKDALLVAYLNESHEAAASLLRTQMLENATRPPADQVAALVAFATQRFLTNPGSSVLSRAELRRASPESTAIAHRMRRDSADFLAGVIRRGRASRELQAPEPPDRLAITLLSTARQAAPWLQRWPLAPVDVTADALGEFSRRIVISSTRVDVAPLPRLSGRPGTSTRERILRAATDHFANSGYTSGSLRDIANSVGIRPPSIYEHYASKDHVLAAVVELVVGWRVDAADRATSRSGDHDVVDVVVDLLRDLVGISVVAPEPSIAVDAEFDHLPASLATPLANRHRWMVETLAGLVREGRAAGRFHYAEPTPVVVFGVLAIAMQAAWLVLEDPRLDPAGLVADSVSYALRVLVTD